MAGLAHLAGPLRVGEHQLVDDDVVRVDATLGQLLDQPLRLVQGQELCDAHADEGCLLLGGGERGGEESDTSPDRRTDTRRYLQQRRRAISGGGGNIERT